MGNQSISIVIPAYNEETNIEDVALESLKVLQSLTNRYEVLVMNDASQDSTGRILDRLAEKYSETIRVFHHLANQGTNLSLIELFRKAQYDLVFFLPADKQILPQSILNYLLAVQRGADIVLGWRVKRRDLLHRSFFNWLYRVATRFLLGVSFRDAAASDLYKKSILDQIPMESRGRLLQAEIAIKAASLGYKVQEIEVAHYPRKSGKQTGIKPKTIWLSFTDLIRVGPKLRRLGKAGFLKNMSFPISGNH